MNSHGIGDLANTLILKAYDQVLSNSSLASYSTSPKSADWTVRNPLRLRIEHAQILRVEDIERMGELGIVASFQPTHGKPSPIGMPPLVKRADIVSRVQQRATWITSRVESVPSESKVHMLGERSSRTSPNLESNRYSC